MKTTHWSQHSVAVLVSVHNDILLAADKHHFVMLLDLSTVDHDISVTRLNTTVNDLSLALHYNALALTLLIGRKLQ